MTHSKARELMQVYGASSLSDQQLLSLVVGPTGANSLEDKSLVELSKAIAHEIASQPGIGPSKAAALCAAFELGRRASYAEDPYSTQLRQPSDVARYCRSKWGHEEQEHFAVLGLDARQRVRLTRVVGIGSLAHVDVHPREVFRPLVRAGMHSAILVHNHPSGDPEPSDADVQLTHRLAEVGRLVGIPVLDHLLVTRTDSVSFASLGLTPGP